MDDVEHFVLSRNSIKSLAWPAIMSHTHSLFLSFSPSLSLCHSLSLSLSSSLSLFSFFSLSLSLTLSPSPSPSILSHELANIHRCCPNPSSQTRPFNPANPKKMKMTHTAPQPHVFSFLLTAHPPSPSPSHPPSPFPSHPPPLPTLPPAAPSPPGPRPRPRQD